MFGVFVAGCYRGPASGRGRGPGARTRQGGSPAAPPSRGSDTTTPVTSHPSPAARLADACYLAALVCLPWIGLDLLTVTTGRDLGAGLQPAYLLLACAVVLRGTTLRRRAARAMAAASLREPTARWLLLATTVLAGALALSALGLIVAPSGATPAVAWGRFGRQVIQVAVMMWFALYPAFWTRGWPRWQATAVALTAGLAIQEAYAVVQAGHFLHPQPAFAACERLFTSNPAILAGSEELYLEGRFRGIPRLRGTACEPLYLGNYLLLVLPAAAALAPRRRAAGVVAGAGLLLLLLTWSRGAVLAGLGGVAVWLVMRRRAGLPTPLGRVAAGAAAVLGLTALVAAAIAGGDAWQYPWRRILQSLDAGDWSNLTRLYSMQAAWRAFLASPLVGVGWGQFAFHFPLLVDPLGLQSQFSWPVVNNVPLLILCETGAVGLAAAAATLWWPVRRTWRRLADASPGERALLAATAAAAAAIGLQLLTFSQYNLPHLWVAPGLWVAALREGERG